MVPFETTCVLWHPAHPESVVTGTLHFDREAGISANVIGSLDPDEPTVNLFELPTDEELAELVNLDPDIENSSIDRDPGPFVPILFGVIPGQPITLIDVRRTETSGSMPGHTSEVLSATFLIRGEHLPDGLNTPVRSVTLAFDALDDWYETSLSGGNFPGTLNESDEATTLQWKTPQAIEAQLGSGDIVRLTGSTARHDGMREFRMALNPEFSVQYLDRVRLREAIDVITPLRWLTSLATRRAARITRLHAVDADESRRDFDILFRATEPPGEHQRVQPYAMAVRLPDLDFPTALPRWMDASERLRTPMALFFANWFSPFLYGENRLLNAAGAAESLAMRTYPDRRTALTELSDAVDRFVSAFPEEERRLLRQRLDHINDPSLREDLRRLVADAGAAFHLVVGDTSKWVDLVVQTRNDIAHGNKLSDKGVWLRALSETTEHLIEIHLFMQLGMTSTQVEEALRETPRTRWIADLANQYLFVNPGL